MRQEVYVIPERQGQEELLPEYEVSLKIPVHAYKQKCRSATNLVLDVYSGNQNVPK